MIQGIDHQKIETKLSRLVTKPDGYVIEIRNLLFERFP